MIAPSHKDRVVSDPIGLIVDLVGTVEQQLTPEQAARSPDVSRRPLPNVPVF